METGDSEKQVNIRKYSALMRARGNSETGISSKCEIAFVGANTSMMNASVNMVHILNDISMSHSHSLTQPRPRLQATEKTHS